MRPVSMKKAVVKPKQKETMSEDQKDRLKYLGELALLMEQEKCL
jgi:hypothetical protein